MKVVSRPSGLGGALGLEWGDDRLPNSVSGPAPGTGHSAGAEHLWVVCPSYRDVEAFRMLRQRVSELLATSELQDWSLRFVLVDDTGATDDQVGELAELNDVTVVTPPFNLGHQRALVHGLRTVESRLADSDLVVTMDADGEDRPEDLPHLLAPLLANPERRNLLCIAHRTKRRESLKFKSMYLLFRVMFKTMTGVTIRNGNYAAYRGWLARRMVRHPYFDLCYSSTLVSLDLPVVRVPCPRGERYAGRSRMNAFRLLMHGLRMLMPFTDRIAVRALAVFTTLFGISLLAALAVASARLFASVTVPLWATATLVSVCLFSLLALGNFMVLFVVFSHSRGLALEGLDRTPAEESLRSA